MAAVDFDEKFLVTGHEDSTVGVWDNRVRKKNEEPIPHRLSTRLVFRILNDKIAMKFFECLEVSHKTICSLGRYEYYQAIVVA